MAINTPHKAPEVIQVIKASPTSERKQPRYPYRNDMLDDIVGVNHNANRGKSIPQASDKASLVKKEEVKPTPSPVSSVEKKQPW